MKIEGAIKFTFTEHEIESAKALSEILIGLAKLGIPVQHGAIGWRFEPCRDGRLIFGEQTAVDEASAK